ncbi:ATP-binding protein [Thermodesulfobacteriota bacterium]
MPYQYSINLKRQNGIAKKNLIYKDQRITDRNKLEFLYELSTILMQSLDIKEICEMIMDSLFKCLKRIDYGAILWKEDGSRGYREIIERSRNGTTEEGKKNYSRSIVNRVLNEGKAVVMSDTKLEDKEDLSESIETKRIKSIMCVPLMIKSKVRGAIYVHSDNVPYGFRKDDLFLFIGLSTPAALSIENALLYSKQNSEEKAPQSLKLEMIRTLAVGVAHGFNNLFMGIQGNVSLMLENVSRHNPHNEESRPSKIPLCEEGGASSNKMAFLFGATTQNMGISSPQTHCGHSSQCTERGVLAFSRDRLIDIERFVEKGKELTENLLAYAGLGNYQVEAINPNEIISKISEQLRKDNQEIHVHGKYQNGIWHIEVNEGQFEKIISNLVSNAVEAMPEGGELHIETENVVIDDAFDRPEYVKSGNYVKISLTDTGLGMDLKTQLRLFFPFFTTKPKRIGTGLGLSAVHGMIRNHSGFTKIFSEKGQGTIFIFYLPALIT